MLSGYKTLHHFQGNPFQFFNYSQCRALSVHVNDERLQNTQVIKTTTDMPIHGSSHLLKWLDSLKAAQLHRLAILLGTPCSGTKDAIKRLIRESLPRRSHITRDGAQTPPLSLISIDMGIRNLAYAHLKADSDVQQTGQPPSKAYQRPHLCAWEKVVIAPSLAISPPTSHPRKTETTVTRKRTKRAPESFAPSLYATHAVKLITGIIDVHRPTHILIERQRFRSGGSPIVQDWSIRVGVFEGMLYAVLKTLAEKCGVDVEVAGVEPARVNRFWLGTDDALDGAMPKGRAMKDLKIGLVREALEGTASPRARKGALSLEVDGEARPMADAFLSRCAKDNRLPMPPSDGSESTSDESVTELKKLDDLADSLLQGMAWIEWQNNRGRVAASGDEEASPFV